MKHAPIEAVTHGAELYTCRGPLDDTRSLLEALQRGADRVGATVMETSSASYQPHGVTCVLILAESHILVSTWPEYGYAMLDMMLCNASMDSDAVIDEICDHLRPTEIRRWSEPHRIGFSPSRQTNGAPRKLRSPVGIAEVASAEAASLPRESRRFQAFLDTPDAGQARPLT